MSRLDLIAGPNGAGKTTIFERLIEPDRPGLPFVNPDRIAAHRFPGQELQRAHDAAAIANQVRGALIEAGIDFCTETVFSHPSKVELVHTATAAGFDVVAHVVMIPVELCAQRVARRVALGGHDVPADKIVERYDRLWPLVAASIPACAYAVFYDNSTPDGPRTVGAFRYGVADSTPTWPEWTPPVLRGL